MQSDRQVNAARTTTEVLIMKLGFICPNVPGHLNPMTALARQLQARNHEVIFLYSRSAAGLPCFDITEKDHINEHRPAVSKMQGEDVLLYAFRMVMSQTEAILESLPTTVQETGVDALLLDTVQFYAELGAIKLGMPYIHISLALHFDYTGHTPLGIYDWPHETTAQGLARNREGVTRFVEMLNDANSGVKAYAENAGLNVNWEDPSSTHSRIASISQTPATFDFESSHWPPQFHHAGPFHDGKGREPVDFPWERLTGEPVIYASMGTILNGQLDVFRTIVAAVAKRNDVQLVLSIGDQIDPELIGPVPSNAIIVKRAPQLELLKRTSVCITHAGLNTVLECLAQGVPQVAIPVSFDQPGVAARIAHKQTGVVASLDKLTSDHLAVLLDEVLNDSRYRENARKIQNAFAQSNGLSMGADLVEQALGVKRGKAVPETTAAF
jgi:zeaxanthin glucosyltransferase